MKEIFGRSSGLRLSAHSSVFHKVKKCALPDFQCLRGKKIVAYHPAHYRSRGKIKYGHTYQRKNSLMRVHFAEFAGCHTVLDQAGKPLVKRAKVFADDPFDLGSFHHLALNQTRIVRMRSEKVKISVHPGDQAIA